LHRYERADQVFDLTWCHITTPELMEVWQLLLELRTLLPSGLQQVVLRLDRKGTRHLVLRVGSGDPWSRGTRLSRALEAQGMPVTVWWQPRGGAARVVDGRGENSPATVFEQVHPEMGDRVRQFAIGELGELSGRRVWDLYAGIGETTEELVTRGALVESVELDPDAVAEAEANGSPARRHVGRVEDLLDHLGSPDLVIVNPPRTGMDGRVVVELNRLAPARLVYISCDPATLARDLQRLHRFQVRRVQAFDLFPQTTHVETVTVLEPA
jgi:tRNA/tmRNA/rRNA uracil-C5-methylase (TrmA/RlmC/RlmD family)